MPWHNVPKKDVISRDSRRWGANILWPGGVRMG